MINYDLEDFEKYKSQFMSHTYPEDSIEETYIMYQTYLAITDYIITKISEQIIESKISNENIILTDKQINIINNRKIAREEINKIESNVQFD